MADPDNFSPVGGTGGLRPPTASFIQAELELQDVVDPGNIEPTQPLTPPSDHQQKVASAPPWQPIIDGPTNKATTVPSIGVDPFSIPESEGPQIEQIFDSATRPRLPRNDNMFSQILAQKTKSDASFKDLMHKVANKTASNQDLDVFSKEMNAITYELIQAGQAVRPGNMLFVRGLSVKNCAVEVYHLLKAKSQGPVNSLALALFELAREQPRVAKVVKNIATDKCVVADAEVLKKLMQGLQDDLDSRQTRHPVVPPVATAANKPLTDSGYGSTTDSVRVSNIAMYGHGKEDDARTTYSVDTYENTPNSRIYIEHLANDIYNNLQPFDIANDWSILSESLPELLHAFADQIGNASISQPNQDIMHFIHNQHLNIVKKLEDLIFQRRDTERERPLDDPDSESMSLSDKIDMWHDKRSVEDSESQAREKPTGAGDDDPNTNPSFAPLLYDQIVLNSKGYGWLLTSLKKLLSVQWFRNNPSSKISEIHLGILEMLRTDSVGKRRVLTQHVIFQLPIESFTLQRHRWILTNSKDRGSLSELMVLTTSSQDMQLTRVREYVDQTWPTFGKRVLRLLENVSDRHGEQSNSCDLPDGTSLSVRKYRSCLVVSLKGLADSIAACGEELSWLAAAVTYIGNGPTTYVTPSIRKLNGAELDALPNWYIDANPGAPRIVGIKIELSEHPASTSQWQQSLWHRSFEHHFTPVIVQGYPTAHRPEGYPGVEVCFDVLLDALRSWKVAAVYPSLQLRGNNVTLRLAKEIDGIFYWHERRGRSTSPCLTQRFSTNPSASLSLLPTDSGLRAGRHIICDCESRAENNNDETSSASNPSSSRSASLQTGILSTSSDSIKVHRLDKNHPGFRFFMEILREAVQRYVSQTSHGFTSDEGECHVAVTTSYHSCVSMDVLPDMVHHCLSWVPNSCGFNTNHQPSVSSQSEPSTNESSSASSSQPGACKRQQSNGKESGDDQGGLQPRKRIKLPARSLKKPRFLACPYWKFDHVKHWDCFLKKITTISYVKQHLARRHTPAHYCQRCFAIFEDDVVLDDHVIGGSCERDPMVKLEGISHSQSKRLSQKSKGTIEQQWYVMWSILFPDEQNPSSIYVDADQSRDFALLREFSQNDGVAILHDHLRASGQILRSDVTETKVRETILQGLDSMFEYFRLGQGSNSDLTASQNDSRTADTPTSREALTGSISADSGALLSSHGSSHGSHAEEVTVTMSSEQDNCLTSSFYQHTESSRNLHDRGVDSSASLHTGRDVDSDTGDVNSEMWRDMEETLNVPNLDDLLNKILVNGNMSGFGDERPCETDSNYRIISKN